MPYYDYRCKKCGIEFERSMKIADRDLPTQETSAPECPEAGGSCEIEMMVAGPYVGDPWHFAGKKPDEAFKDRLREIKKTHRGSTINV